MGSPVRENFGFPCRLDKRRSGGFRIGLVFQRRQARDPGHPMQVRGLERLGPSVDQPFGRALDVTDRLTASDSDPNPHDGKCVLHSWAHSAATSREETPDDQRY
jgi:hypothetical protein